MGCLVICWVLEVSAEGAAQQLRFEFVLCSQVIGRDIFAGTDSYHYIIIAERSIYFLLLCASLCCSKHSIAILLATFEFIALSRSQNFSIQIKSINLITFHVVLFYLKDFCYFFYFLFLFRYLLCNCAIGRSNFFLCFSNIS